MVSDQEIASCVEALLRQQSSDPANAGAAVSLSGVVQQVEAKLGLDLSHKTNFIRDQIDLLLGPPRPPPHFIFQSPHQILFQPYPQLPAASSPFAQFGSHQEIGFRYPAPTAQMASAGGAGVGVVAVAPPPQYGHGPVAPGSKPIGSALGKESAPTGVKRRGGPGGLNKLCGVTPELQVIVGEPAMPRTQIVKQLWAYIRKNNLQDPNNKRKIICNDELRVVFETDCTDMFQMNKLLSKHIIPLDDFPVDPVPKKLKTGDAEAPTEPHSLEDSLGVSADEQSASVSFSEQHVAISDALANFLGTQEKELLQSEALRRVSDYIKDNRLEDPEDTSMIRCDAKLQQLFGCENLSALGVPDMLACHLSKIS